ncbi:MAG: transglutaminase domain-containing protein, partial [Acidobacteriota bacterium]|nr:transglutaminase domain-containing protein [Acidobacteriota bacterium]
SNIIQPDADDLRKSTREYPADLQLNYLQLPVTDPRIARLAEQITVGKNNDYDKATALEAYLRTHFGYTLQLPRTTPHDPLADFLFERKQGHCEYFASSMAVMLRTLKIPSRVVNGFRSGEYNDLSSKYVVRGSNAHSWVEVYFPEAGWISFDPTPAGGPEMHTGWNRLTLYMDAMASFWREWVVNYDVSHQENLGQSVFQHTRTTFQKLADWARRNYQGLLSSAHRAQDVASNSPAKWGTEVVIALALVLLAANLKRLWRMARSINLARHPGKSPRVAASIWYERMVRLIARRGWRKPPNQTAAEFAGAIEDPGVRTLVENFNRRYEKARFGDSADDAIHLPEMYEEIATAAPKSRGPARLKSLARW